MVSLTKAAVKASGVDYASEKAKEIRMLALADYARTPEGQKDIIALTEAAKNMEKFEKAPTLMHSLQSQSSEQTPPKQTMQNTLMQMSQPPKKMLVKPIQKEI